MLELGAAGSLGLAAGRARRRGPWCASGGAAATRVAARAGCRPAGGAARADRDELRQAAHPARSRDSSDLRASAGAERRRATQAEARWASRARGHRRAARLLDDARDAARPTRSRRSARTRCATDQTSFLDAGRSSAARPPRGGDRRARAAAAGGARPLRGADASSWRPRASTPTAASRSSCRTLRSSSADLQRETRRPGHRAARPQRARALGRDHAAPRGRAGRARPSTATTSSR